MKKQIVMAVIVVLMLVAAAWAADITCPNPYHHNAPCFSTGQVRYVNGRQFVQYRCTCGDQYWVE